MQNIEEFEESTGWRSVFHALPNTKNMAHKAVMPLGIFYSPFLVANNPIKSSPAFCSKCHSSICNTSIRNRQSRQWQCNFCSSSNPYLAEIGTSPVE